MSDPHRDPIVIVSAARTPIGGMLGDFASLTASDLGAWPSRLPLIAPVCRPTRSTKF